MYAGDDNAARAGFHAAISTARTPEELARAYTDYYWLPYRHGDFEGGLSILEEALARLPADATVARARVDGWVGWTLGRLHRLDESIAHLTDAARVLGASDDREGAMRVFDQLGIMLEMVHRSDEAIEWLERSLAITLELRDLKGEAMRTHLGTALTRSGHPGRARPHLERALEITHQMGDRYLESVAAWAIAEMEDALGNYGVAKEMRVRELSLLASVGGNPHNEALSHAHLAHLARLAADTAAADAEAAEARRLAAASPHVGYAARIEEALAVERWADLETG
jgi:tetratricopeptide (TPR) repeat protein